MYGIFDEKTKTIHTLTKTLADFELKIEKAYWSSRGMQAQGENYTIDDFMLNKRKVKFTMEEI